MSDSKTITRGERFLSGQKVCAVIVAFFVCCFGAALPVLADGPSGFKPLTVRVVDSLTLLPVTNFTYSYWIDNPSSPCELNGENIPVVSPDGRFEIPAPASCKITIAALAPDFVAGHSNYKDFEVRSDDVKRQIVVRLQRGFLLRGTVRDKRTKLPVVDAMVAPMIFTPPISSPDENRGVRTDGLGRFEVRGVDEFGVRIAHSNYATVYIDDFKRDLKDARPGGTITREINLKTGNIAKGIVTSPSGKPVENAIVDDYYGCKIARTGKDGSFEIRGASRDWEGDRGKSFYLSVSKDGYIDKTIFPTRIPSKGLRVVLEPTFPLNGSVTDSVGKPVTIFTIAAGPGRNPPTFESTQQVVTNSDGVFSLGLSNPGTNWVGVRAPGFATWEGSFLATRTATNLEVRLQPGWKLTGSVNPFRSATVVSLVPVRPNPDVPISCMSPAVELGTLREPVDPAGRFEFQHVRPDQYSLKISGPFITSTNLELTVINADLVLPPITVAGVGAIKGQAFKSTREGGGVWAFANGKVIGAGELVIEFKTDENGRFTIENVPTGNLEVGIEYNVSADVIESENVSVTIAEGKTSEIVIGPSK